MNPLAPNTEARLRAAAHAAVEVAHVHAFARYVEAETPPAEALVTKLAEPVPVSARPLARSFVLIADSACRRSPHP